MADYLSRNYGATDSYYPAGIPTTLPACGSQPITTCVADAFVAANGQPANFMTAADLTGSSSAVRLPASTSTADAGRYLSSCIIDDWQQASETQDNDDVPVLISQSGQVDVACTDIGGSVVSSSFNYTECGQGTIFNANGILACNNTISPYFSSADFDYLGSIDTTTKKTIDISLQFYTTDNPSVSIIYQTNDNSSANSWIQEGDGGTYLFDTGSTAAYLALLQDNSTGYAFNLVYTYESMSLGCPNSDIGGYTTSYCQAVDFGSNTELCPVVSSTYPFLCSCVHVNGDVFYCLEQWVSCGDGCDRYEEIATLTSCPSSNPEACQAPQ
jgi:hypothetical protein